MLHLCDSYHPLRDTLTHLITNMSVIKSSTTVHTPTAQKIVADDVCDLVDAVVEAPRESFWAVLQEEKGPQGEEDFVESLDMASVSSASKICVLCKKAYIGYGNNAQPLAEGKCCDDCNGKVVASRFADLVAE